MLAIAEDAAKWLETFYSNRGVCITSANVSEIEVAASTLTVHLETENNYVERLHTGGGEQLVQDWLALHCPLPLVAYSNALGGKDVVVQWKGRYSLSCREFEKNLK